MQRVPDLVQGQGYGLIRRLLLEEEADRATRLLEIAVTGMGLVACREDRADRARIDIRQQLHRPRLQGIAVGRRQEPFEHEEAVALVGCHIGGCHIGGCHIGSCVIGDAHWPTRSMTTGRGAGLASSMRTAARTRAIAASASASLAA